MIQIKDPKDCCGCTACASICDHDAITMKPDPLGFLYPTVNEEKCIKCGLCERVCAFNDHYDTNLNLNKPLVYGARHKDIHEVETSRSGAAFIAFSDSILEHGGVVYGAGYTDHFRVVHKRAITKEERDEFKGSKYVQSDMNTVFRQVKSDLKNGLMVLFSGTPCQTAGLNSYIEKRFRDNLYLLDIVCHGVPSPYVWRDYVKYVEEKYGGKITNIDFRNKRLCGWEDHKESFVINGHEYLSSSYTNLFYSDILYRKACNICYFTNTNRPSDITLADFWGWEKTDEQFNTDNKGCSLIFCNTEKGSKWFESVKNQLYIIRPEFKDYLQPNLLQPSKASKKTAHFVYDYVHKGFPYCLKRYGNVGWRFKITTFKSKVVNKLNRIAKKIL